MASLRIRSHIFHSLNEIQCESGHPIFETSCYKQNIGGINILFRFKVFFNVQTICPKSRSVFFSLCFQLIMNILIPLGVMIIHSAKLRMLEYYYDSLDRLVRKKKQKEK